MRIRKRETAVAEPVIKFAGHGMEASRGAGGEGGGGGGGGSGSAA